MVFLGGEGVLGGARWDIQVQGFGGCCPEQVGGTLRCIFGNTMIDQIRAISESNCLNCT